MDAEYKMNRWKRSDLEKKSKKNHTLKDEYVQQRNLCAKMTISKQGHFYSGLISEAGGDQKALFKIVHTYIFLDTSHEHKRPPIILYYATVCIKKWQQEL